MHLFLHIISHAVWVMDEDTVFAGMLGKLGKMEGKLEKK